MMQDNITGRYKYRKYTWRTGTCNSR